MSAPTLFVAASSRDRRERALALLGHLPALAPVIVVGSTREAASDLLRESLGAGGALVGRQAMSLGQLALRLAESDLASRGLAPAGQLATEAVAARAAFEDARRRPEGYFQPVSGLPGFPSALAQTLSDVRLAGLSPADLAGQPAPTADVGQLLDEYERQMARARMADRATLLTAATAAVARGGTTVDGAAVVLLDVPIHAEVECRLVDGLGRAASVVLLTVPEGDERTSSVAALRGWAREVVPPRASVVSSLARVAQYLFSSDAPPPQVADDSVQVFSAPGEGREAVEIARRLSTEAERGVRFDEMAVLVRSPEAYAGLLEHALRRARVPAYFSRGTRRPDPSGRAFLALLACAAEHVSARRFAEYLSLGQVPRLGSTGAPPVRAMWQPAADEMLAVRLPPAEKPVETGPRSQWLPFDEESDAPTPVASESPDAASAADAREGPAIYGTLRAPRQWESLLVESAVIAGRARWQRRLDGLSEEYDVRVSEAARDDPDSPLVSALRRAREQLAHLRAFALPVVADLANLPERAPWGEWLDVLATLAPRVLVRAERVLAVLAELRPMSAVGPVGLNEVRTVLGERLTTVSADPPHDRHGRVFVGTPEQARGRAFRVVFVPGLAERMFPQRPRQDPLLLDADRARFTAWMRRSDDAAVEERLRLRLAVGAAHERLHLSFPRLDVAQSRPRVPSFYALDIVRAITGRVPHHDELAREAAAGAEAWLAWPAPVVPAHAIDDQEYDLAVLGAYLRPTALLTADRDELRRQQRGRARYLLEVSPPLARSLRAQYARGRRRWTEFDGLVRSSATTRLHLARHRPSARAFSVSALQRFAVCPYQFLLGSIYRLEPFDPPEPLERLDPLTKGAMFHEVQRDTLRELKRRGRLPIAPGAVDEALLVLDEVLLRVSQSYEERLAPAIERVWRDEVDAMRADLRTWARLLSADTGGWVPEYFEFSFGLPLDDDHDEASVREPVALDERFHLRGAIDLVERHVLDGTLRITDHKTGKRRARPGSVIGGGELLQPVVYSLAAERALGHRVSVSRLWYCTSAGEFSEHPIVVDDEARRAGTEAFEIVDRAVAEGALPQFPRDASACVWCGVRSVCGPDVARRVAGKDRDVAVTDEVSHLRGRR